VSKRIRVVVADDEEGYRRVLRQVLSEAPDLELVGVARDGKEALRMCEEGDVDVLLIDIEMPVMDGIECIREISRRRRDIAFVVLTVHEEDEVVFDAIRSGATGYLLKTSRPSEVVEAIKRASSGEAMLTPRIATKILQEFREKGEEGEISGDHLCELSRREKEILALVAEGLRNKEIAGRLKLSEKTVKNHVSNILKALQVNSRTEAAMKALRKRLEGQSLE
jgi:DNA-binding NarL/FixJ family response regulator